MKTNFLLMACIGALVAGCATYGNKASALKCESRSSGAVEITRANASSTGDESIRVWGDVRMRTGHIPPSQSHLDVVLLNEQGEVLARKAVRYSPWPMQSRRHGEKARGEFLADLKVSAEQVKTVRVTHHENPFSLCRAD